MRKMNEMEKGSLYDCSGSFFVTIMNDGIFENFFGEKPHRDGALAESRWGLNSYKKLINPL